MMRQVSGSESECYLHTYEALTHTNTLTDVQACRSCCVCGLIMKSHRTRTDASTATSIRLLGGSALLFLFLALLFIIVSFCRRPLPQSCVHILENRTTDPGPTARVSDPCQRQRASHLPLFYRTCTVFCVQLNNGVGHNGNRYDDCR